MPRQDPHDWMWAEAVAMLARAERGQRAERPSGQAPPRRVPRPAAWTPAVDVIETEAAVLILVSLPGVAAEAVEAALEGDSVVVSGRRTLPPELQTAVIHRLELPMGRFERRIAIPPGRYDGVRRDTRDGCLLISLHKA
ncbi:Hsp20/alpha crystallin family protein [Lichenibacterium minor]|uniref:Hsp20/alpha crystallin family protein n=1 Tax=Lichenibacterium minor TaxID=2316528 RepID=A0A4Q2U8Q9_9HYPH|nr:Hsp20 family protein [Lichenibacterium minor]RYC32258.1 Hsp20/alpha crystallin family protein [Lichenibacterium minor]